MTDTIMFILYLIVLIATFPALYYVSENYFINSLESISRRFKISSDIAGSTLMAAGSSTPELAVVLFALLKSGDHGAIGVGTIVGSALFNLFVIIGAVFLIHRSKLVWQPLIRDIIFYTISIILLVFFFKDGDIVMAEALIFVTIYIIYIFLMYFWKKLIPYDDTEKVLPEKKEMEVKNNTRCSAKTLMHSIDKFIRKLIPGLNNIFIAFIFSLALICGLSWLMVESAIQISHFLGIPEVIIGLTVIAIGTSVPDLLSSIIVAKKGRPGMAINNAIGSNIFDILIGFGLPWLLLLIFSDINIVVENNDLWIAIGLLIGSVLILTISFIANKWETKKSIGYTLIILYIIYLIWEIIGSTYGEIINFW